METKNEIESSFSASGSAFLWQKHSAQSADSWQQHTQSACELPAHGRNALAMKRRALLNEVVDAPAAARQRDHAARRTWCGGRFGSARVLSPSAASSPLLRTYISAWPELQSAHFGFSPSERLAVKRSLVALAALAITGSASAQSSITMFGVVDAGISYYANKNTAGVTASQKAVSNSGYNASRFGVRGTEDLGGGLAASFWLEAPITNDDGQGILMFSRRSTVSISGGFGEIRAGRDYTPTFRNDVVFDPFLTAGVGANMLYLANHGFGRWLAGTPATGSTYVRSGNSVGYFLPPNLGGFYGQVMYSFNEREKFDPGTATPATLHTQRTGRYLGGRAGYANGPLDVAASYSSAIIGDDFYAGTTTAVKTWNLGAWYDFGVAKLMGEYSSAKKSVDSARPWVSAPDNGLKGYLMGVTVPIGPGLIRASYSQVKYDQNQPSGSNAAKNPQASKFALGYVHNLSKRTALYAAVARLSNKHGAALSVAGPAFAQGQGALPKTSTGYDFGIRHAF